MKVVHTAKEGWSFACLLTIFRSCRSRCSLIPAPFIHETRSERGNGSSSAVLLSDTSVVPAAAAEGAVAAAGPPAVVCEQSSLHARRRHCLSLFAVKRCTCAGRTNTHIYQGDKVNLNSVSRA